MHWHGVRVENAMDGVPDMPLPPIKPGESFTYEFVAARRRHVLVPPARRHAARPRALRRADRRGAPTRRSTTTARPSLVLDDFLDGIDGTPDAKLDDAARRGHADAGHGPRWAAHARAWRAWTWASAMGLGGMDVSALGDGSLVVPGRFVTRRRRGPDLGDAAGAREPARGEAARRGRRPVPALPRQRPAAGRPVRRRGAAAASGCAYG